MYVYAKAGTKASAVPSKQGQMGGLGAYIILVVFGSQVGSGQLAQAGCFIVLGPVAGAAVLAATCEHGLAMFLGRVQHG